MTRVGALNGLLIYAFKEAGPQSLVDRKRRLENSAGQRFELVSHASLGQREIRRNANHESTKDENTKKSREAKTWGRNAFTALEQRTPNIVT